MNCPKCGAYLDGISFNLVDSIDSPPSVVVVCDNCDWVASAYLEESDFIEVKGK